MRHRTTAISIGCNAVTHVVDWSQDGLIAFGANRSVAIYDPTSSFGVYDTLNGHTDRVTVVRWLNNDTIVSGSSDSTVKIWRQKQSDAPSAWACVQTLTDHKKSVSAIATCGQFFVSGSMDGTYNVYHVPKDGLATLAQANSFKPYLPLALAMARIPDLDSYVLAVGGTATSISIYGSTPDQKPGEIDLEFKAKLTGHEDWIRAFDFIEDKGTLLLASSSQDRYIRLWRFDERRTDQTISVLEGALASLAVLENKAHDFTTTGSSWKVSFEALLVSHEDWVFSVQFSRNEENFPILLSSSADSSVIIWRPDAESQIWTVQAQLGVISTKGASTATGSTGGFWGAIFSPKTMTQQMICAWNKTGSLRIWQKDIGMDGAWRNIGGVGGHVKEVRSLSWSPGGEYFLTTALDQSTRLWAKHTDDTWKEFARPQIHGYDIQSIHVIGPALFISGAEEKIVRIFQATTSVVDLLARVAKIDFTQESTAEAANVPALGLSNKALTSTNQGTHLDRSDLEETIEKDNTPISKAMLDSLDRPPTEDHLQRHTLFPELEKLYGHGYEIQALSASHDGRYIVSGCRANTPEHAVLRLYDAKTYKALSVLEGHALTATKAKFSLDDNYLISVSRDRSFCLYVKTSDGGGYKLLQRASKAHKRIIWDVSWLGNDTFAMASRDGTVSIWRVVDNVAQRQCLIEIGDAATSLAWSPVISQTTPSSRVLLAVGLEDGTIKIYSASESKQETVKEELSLHPCDAAITGIGFRNRPSTQLGETLEVAFCSEDCSVRVIELEL